MDFDNSLNAVVRKLRSVLGDDSETPRYIETLPRIGCRFIGAIKMAEPVPLVEPTLARGAAIRWPMAGLLVFFAAVGALFLVLRMERTPTPEVPAAAGNLLPRRTTNERAYDLYLQGIFNRSRRDTNGAPLASRISKPR